MHSNVCRSVLIGVRHNVNTQWDTVMNKSGCMKLSYSTAGSSNVTFWPSVPTFPVPTSGSLTQMTRWSLLFFTQQLSMHHIYNDIFPQAAVSELGNIRIHAMSFMFSSCTARTQESLLWWVSAESGGASVEEMKPTDGWERGNDVLKVAALVVTRVNLCPESGSELLHRQSVPEKFKLENWSFYSNVHPSGKIKNAKILSLRPPTSCQQIRKGKVR